MRVRLLVLSACVLAAAVGMHAAQGQQPAAPGAPGAQGGPARGGGAPAPLMNIKVLPKEWTRQQVQALMQTFVESLGVAAPAGAPPPPGSGCLHCHAAPAADAAPAQPGGRGPAVDYSSDANPKKDVARKMIQMVMASNANYLKDVGDTAVPEKVSCYSCHRGETKPVMMPAAGWGRGGFSLLPAGPPVPARGAGAPGGGAPAGGAPGGARGN